MSLLCQLYSLYESIQEYKGACQADSNADCTYLPQVVLNSLILTGCQYKLLMQIPLEESAVLLTFEESSDMLDKSFQFNLQGGSFQLQTLVAYNWNFNHRRQQQLPEL
uniref:Uncharacterized protein n=1 Tax=Amazona collaria TaxID=241587 RepID=A0A8B9GCT7_9PSIT